MLELLSDPLDLGQEHAYYVHPDDPRLAVKIPYPGHADRAQNEIRFYQRLRKKKAQHSRHLPAFHGKTPTNHGDAIVVDLIRDFDGQLSKPLRWYLHQGFPIEDFEPGLDELLQSLLQNRILFEAEQNIDNLLFQKRSMTRGRIVAIDGFDAGGVIDWHTLFPAMARREIQNRWQTFLENLYNTPEVRAQMEGRERSIPLSARSDDPA